MLSWWWFVALWDQEISFYETKPFYDLLTDSSFQRYIGNWQKLDDIHYIPQDLVSIESDFTANSSRRFSLRKEAADQFADLAWHFWHDFDGDRLYITSAYRSASFQTALLNRGCPLSRCAEAWASEHQLWLAIDLWVMTKNWKYISLSNNNKYYQRLLKYSSHRWFHNSFQNGIDIDGQIKEGRHRRYLWEDLATELYDQWQSFSQRYAIQKRINQKTF